jgi:hypothetical protein
MYRSMLFSLTPPLPSPTLPLSSVKRAWLPNVQRKALWSDALNRSISLRVTTTALRQMDRMGKFGYGGGGEG